MAPCLSSIGRSSICCGAPASAPGPTSSTPTASCRSPGAVETPAQLRADPRRRRREDRPAGIRQVTTRRDGAFSPQPNIARRAAALAVPDGAQRSAAPGEDDALLAQPLRHGVLEDRRRRSARPKATRYMAAKASEDPGGVRGQIEMLRDNALGNFRDLLVDDRQGHGDARVARRPAPTRGRGRRRTSAARSWSSSRWASAHYTEADVYAGGARVHRLEPDAARRAADGSQHYEFVYNADAARHRREDFSFADLSRRQQDDPGARGRRRACRTASTSSTRWPPARHRRATSPASCIASSCRSSATSATPFVEPHRVRVPARAGYDMKAVMREVLLSPRVLGPRARTSPATRGRSSSSCAR